MDTPGDASEQPIEGSDDQDAPRYALSHTDRQHITLENIELLAELDHVAGLEAGNGAGKPAPPPPEPPAPPAPPPPEPPAPPALAAAPPAPLELPAPAAQPAETLPAPTRPDRLPAPVDRPDRLPAPVDRPDRLPAPVDRPDRLPASNGGPVAWVVAAANPIPTVPAPPRPPAPPVPAALPAGHALPARARWARPADRWLLEALAIAGASGAFVAPSLWLAGLLVSCTVAGIVAFVLGGHPAMSLPRRVLRRTLALLRPRSLLWVPVLTARTVIAAILLPAGAAALIWLLDQGTGDGVHGVVAAARLGAWADGFRVGAALVGVLLLTSVGDGRQRRAAAVRRWSTRLSDRGLTLVAAACVAFAALAIVALPHPADRLASGADGLGWAPAGLRAQLDEARDDIVTAELDALASCLSHHTGTGWQTSYSVGNPLEAADVARLVADLDASAPPPQGLVTAILATHNLLAPWVETIEVRWVDGDLVRTDRGVLPHRQPLTEVDQLVPATSRGREWLDTQFADRATTLRCSASAVL